MIRSGLLVRGKGIWRRPALPTSGRLTARTPTGSLGLQRGDGQRRNQISGGKLDMVLMVESHIGGVSVDIPKIWRSCNTAFVTIACIDMDTTGDERMRA